MTEIQNIIRQKYNIEAEVVEQRKKQEQMEEELPRRMFELRQAKAALLEYESGGFRSFFDKISGKYAERIEVLSQSVRQAEAALAAAKRALESEKERLVRLEETAKTLPTREALFAQYSGMEYLRQQDALFAAKHMLSVLEENEKLLVEARDWAENKHADYVPQGVQYNKSQALQKASTRAKEICNLLERIQKCGYALEIHAYFQNPDGYIAGAARQFGQQDRINYAIRAIRTTQKLIQELILQLADE